MKQIYQIRYHYLARALNDIPTTRHETADKTKRIIHVAMYRPMDKQIMVGSFEKTYKNDRRDGKQCNVIIQGHWQPNLWVDRDSLD
jgi:hypothetical protein